MCELKKLKFSYCGIRVANLDRSLKFYCEVLGLKEVGRGRMNHGGVYVLLQDETTKQKLELNWYPNGSKFYAEYELGEGIDHLGFIVDDVRKTYSEMVSKGAEPASSPWKEVENDDQSWIGFEGSEWNLDRIDQPLNKNEKNYRFLKNQSPFVTIRWLPP